MAASICRLRPGWRPMPWIWSGGGSPCSTRCLTWTSGRRPWPPPCWALGSSWEYQSRAACPPCYPGPRRCGGIPRQWRSRGGNCWHPSGRTTRCWCSLPGTMAFPTRCSTWEFHGCCWSVGIRSSPCPTCPPTTWICRRTTPICTGPLASTSCPGPSSWPPIQTCMPST